MSDLILRQEDIDRFTFSLDTLTRKASVSMCVLVHRDGHLLASAGQSNMLDTTALSALVSANFSSTVAIANLVGEKEFSVQHHAGREKSILVTLIDDYTFLVFVFPNSLSVEPIRAAYDEHRKDFIAALDRMYNNEPEGFLPSGDDLDNATQQPAPSQIIDAEEIARLERDKKISGAQVVPRKLSYTSKPPSGIKAEPAAPASHAKAPRVIREPDADEADFEALAAAISSKGERQQKPSADASGASKDVVMVEGKPMTVVSLKDKKTK